MLLNRRFVTMPLPKAMPGPADPELGGSNQREATAGSDEWLGPANGSHSPACPHQEQIIVAEQRQAAIQVACHDLTCEFLPA